jgi:hypothetical protein
MLNNLTEVKLIYRASIDGFAASSFHSKCDNISNTVTIIETISNSVFGGYIHQLNGNLMEVLFLIKMPLFLV